MTLREYLQTSKLSYRAFGAEADLHEMKVHRFATGKRLPKLDDMTKIVSATKGAVQPNDFYAPPTAPALLACAANAP